jgi:hypothetical protein
VAAESVRPDFRIQLTPGRSLPGSRNRVSSSSLPALVALFDSFAADGARCDYEPVRLKRSPFY